MSCNCPQLVLDTLAARVQSVLDEINRVKHLTTVFNAFFLNVVQEITDDLDILVNAIPLPPVVDISEFIKYFTCPLTPVAIAINFELLNELDPQRIWRKLEQQYRDEIARIKRDYERLVAQFTSARLIQFIRRYINEVYRAFEDPFLWPLDYAEALSITAYVKATCPEVYANPQYPYAAFNAALTDWNFDGLLPSGLDPLVQAVVSKVAQAEARLVAWQAILTVVV